MTPFAVAGFVLFAGVVLAVRMLGFAGPRTPSTAAGEPLIYSRLALPGRRLITLSRRRPITHNRASHP